MDGETRRRADGCNHGNARHHCFLNQLKAGASAEHQNAFVERQASIEERRADQFVDRVVAADILTHHFEIAGRIEQRRAVEPSRVFEDGLRGAQLFGKAVNDFTAHRQMGQHCAAGGVERIDRCFSANAAARCGVEISGSAGVDAIGKRELDAIFRAVDGENVGAGFQNTFGEQEPGGEFAVVAGSAHGDRKVAAVDADLQRLFDGKQILRGRNRIAAEGFVDGNGDDVAAHVTLDYNALTG